LNNFIMTITLLSIFIMGMTAGILVERNLSTHKIEFTKNPPESIHEESDSTGLITCYQFNVKYNNKFVTCIRGYK